MTRLNYITLLFLSICIMSCGSDPIPKPKGLLRLDYPAPDYVDIDVSLPFTFEKNRLASKVKQVKVDTKNQLYGINIDYPQMKATIYLTYIKVTPDNLTNLIKDSQNITQEHTQKADEIITEAYSNTEHKTYGMLYEIGGNAASQSQFYVTDSVNHFLNGSLYFFRKPNYDSIYPAANYLKNDIRHIMESLKWK